MYVFFLSFSRISTSLNNQSRAKGDQKSQISSVSCVAAPRKKDDGIMRG
jgi:hypothetical protein